MSKMSCFGGRMQEYDRISLDRFDGRNLQSTVYFLSHLHEDHTAGLAEKIFCKRLKSNKDIFLYCSKVTQVLLVASKKYRHLKPYIKGLSINTPTTFDIPDPLFEEKEKITVTLLPAFHCPGSVMFLIEGAEGTVLYTGDFRWEHFNIEQMHHLQSGESVKKIKSLYVDTTFCSPENLYIPSRQQCIDAVCQLVHEWTSISPKHIVNIYLRAQFGHEPLLNAVASRLNKKVHVNNHKFGIYNRIQEFHGNFTSDGVNTQLHACDKNCMIEVDGEEVLCSETHDADKVLAILPTTMYFTQFSHLTLDKIIKKINSNFFRACYSFHSSYTEVKDLISYLKPERVFPNVKPPSDSSLAVTQHRLNTMLKECMEIGAGEIIQEQEVKELGTLKTRSGRQMNKRKERESTSDAESLDFGTPVKSAKLSSLEAGEPVSPANSTSTKKGRGRGRGKGKSETVSQPAVGTRRSTRRSAATSSPQNTTPKKSKKSERSPTPDLFLTPVSDSIDQQSSYCGSERSDSELSLFSSQKSIDLPVSADIGSSWTAGSFLAAVSSSSEDDTGAGRCCMFDDEEQTDEHFEDRCLFTDTEEEDLTSKESVSPQDDVDTDPNQALNKPKGKTESQVHTKRGRRGMKSKTVRAKHDICIEQGQTIDDDKDQVDEKSSKLKDKEKDHTDVRNNDKTLQSESVLNIDSTLEKEYCDKDDRLNQSDSSIVQGERDNIDTLNDKNSLLTEATNTYATKDVEDVKGEEARSKGLSQEHKDIVSELQLHLSESTPGSDQDFVATNVNTVGEEIVFIDSSDSEDEITNQDNDCIRNIKTVSKSETESNVEKVSSPMRSNSPSALEDKSQAQSKDSAATVQKYDIPVIQSSDEEILSLGSDKSDINSKGKLSTNSGNTDTDIDTTGNKSIQDDDVIEIVDLTGDGNDKHAENIEHSKPGKKSIKISLLKKTENLKKTIKANKYEQDEVIYNVDDDESESDGIDSSPEWLSVKKAKVGKGTFDAKKSKKIRGNMGNKAVNEVREKTVLKGSGSNEDENKQLSKKELDERAEVRRQAVGFMCETDSESDTDESTDPGSPEAELLYDDYVELSSDSDNEGGIGGKRKGGKANGKSIKGTGDKNKGITVNRYGNTEQRRLNSRKHCQMSDTSLQDASLFKDTDLGENNGDKMMQHSDTEKIQMLKDKSSESMVTFVNVENAQFSAVNESVEENKIHLVTEEQTHSVEGQIEKSLDDEKNIQNMEVSDILQENIQECLLGDIVKNGSEKLVDMSEQTEIVDNGKTTLESIYTDERDKSHDMDNESGEKNNIKEKDKTDMGNNDIQCKDTILSKKCESDDKISECKADDKSLECKADDKSSECKADDKSSECKADDKISECKADDKSSECKADDKSSECKADDKISECKADDKISESVKETINELEEANKPCKKMKEIPENIKHDQKHRNKEILAFTAKRKNESLSVHKTNKKGNEKNTSSKKSKDIDWRKLPSASVSKIVNVSNIINHSDQPAPPGTEDELEPSKSPISPNIEPEVKNISSVISKNRHVKVSQHKTPVSVSKPLPSTSLHKPLYNLFVGGVNSLVPPPSYNYSYPSSAQVSPGPTYPPPGWGQYPYGQPTPTPLPYPTSFMQPPPSMPYPPSIPIQTVSPTPVAAKVVTASSYSHPQATVSFSTSVATQSLSLPSVQSSSSIQLDESASELKQSATHSSTRQKKLAPWQQKKVDMFDRGPSCIAKKEVKKRIEINIGKSKQQVEDDKTLTQSDHYWPQSDHYGPQTDHYGPQADHYGRQSDHYGPQTDHYGPQADHYGKVSKNESKVLDLATIKANISALTGLSVVSTVNSKSPSENEDLPALVEQLNKLQKVQAVLDAMKPQPAFDNEIKESYHYDMSQQTTYIDSRRDDDERKRSQNIRLSRDSEYENVHQDRSYEFGEREREEQSYRPRNYSGFNRRERSYDDYEQWERDVRSYGKRSRNLEYERDDGDRERRRDAYYEGRSREFVRDNRDYLEYEKRERDFEMRYREEEEYRIWLEERRRRDAYRIVRRGSPQRHSSYDDPHCNDPYYNRQQPREPEYEQWIERQGYRETHTKVRHDSYEQYDNQHRQRSAERPTSYSSYVDPLNATAEDNYWNSNDNMHSGGNNYVTDVSPQQRGLPDTRAVKSSECLSSGRVPYSKKPIMARVFSRSGQLLSTQSGWKARHHSASATSTEKETPSDVPVFLTGMNYYDKAANQ